MFCLPTVSSRKDFHAREDPFHTVSRDDNRVPFNKNIENNDAQLRFNIILFLMFILLRQVFI